MTRLHKGYTLAEILVVVTIIVILGLAILVGINPIAQIFKGYDARRRADLVKIKIALEGYYSDHECYPVFPKKIWINGFQRASYDCDSDFLKPYLDSMPCDPNTKEPYIIYLTPDNTSCAQEFAVYAQIYSFFDKSANLIDNCPKTIDAHSSGMSNAEVVFGCSDKKICAVYYGCKSGSCVMVSKDKRPKCYPSFCDEKCPPSVRPDGTQTNCTTLNEDGEYIRECKDF